MDETLEWHIGPRWIFILCSPHWLYVIFLLFASQKKIISTMKKRKREREKGFSEDPAHVRDFFPHRSCATNNNIPPDDCFSRRVEKKNVKNDSFLLSAEVVNNNNKKRLFYYRKDIHLCRGVFTVEKK